MTASMVPERPASGPPIISFRDQHAYLANPWRCPVVHEGIEYPGAEWALQAAKSLDRGFRMRIAVAAGWREAKTAGRGVPLRPGWDGIKRVVMMEILLDKFTRNPGLGAALATTGSAILIEGNTWGDTYWGAVPPETVLDPAGMALPLWVTSGKQYLAGHNWLGCQLMMVRDLLQPENPQ
jgi:predicted NAD-dependent protein-ADP-ribosyltransferase YbiA (DUF1768 family)